MYLRHINQKNQSHLKKAFKGTDQVKKHDQPKVRLVQDIDIEKAQPPRG